MRPLFSNLALFPTTRAGYIQLSGWAEVDSACPGDTMFLKLGAWLAIYAFWNECVEGNPGPSVGHRARIFVPFTCSLSLALVQEGTGWDDEDWNEF